jgi:ribosomal protein S1
LTDFGAFVEVEEGVDGLVHVSDITWSKKVKHPKDVLKKDQEVDAVVTSIDVGGQRMSLSIKELTPSAWEAFVATHRTGATVRGKISRFAGFGVFVQLGEDLEGLCHISELSDERVNKPEDVVSLGQEMDFKILRIENDVQKIGLSARAVGREPEPTVDTKMYSTEAKGGMTSLGELMNLKRGASNEADTAEEPRLSKKERKAQQAKDKAEEVGSDYQTETNSGETDSHSQTNAVSGETSDESTPTVETASAETSTDESGTQAVADDSAEVSTQEESSEASNESVDSVEAATGSTETVSESNQEAASEIQSGASEANDQTPDSQADSAATEDSTPAPKEEAADENTTEVAATDLSNAESETMSAIEVAAPGDASVESAPDNKVGDSETAADAEEKSAKG